MNWTERSRTLDTNRNILICDDDNLRKYPIRTAAHVIHYSLPNKLHTFLQRHIACFGFYAENMEQELVCKVSPNDLDVPISLTYFDDNLCDEFIQIYQFLASRTRCELPELLTDTVEVRLNLF